jgi:deazaflavin-dependent oxidoreductase (nitroreductase family)
MTAADTSRRTRPAYRPSWVQQRANTLLTRALRKGRGPSFMRLLTVRGRTTGTVRTTPVVPVRDGDRTWVVSPFGEVAWVRNARATGRVDLRRGDEHGTYAVRELGAAEAVPVLRRYLSMPSRFFVRRHVDVTAKSTDDAIAAEAHRHPVFELTPIR